MLHKKLILLCVLIISLYGSNIKEQKQELLDYSRMQVDKGVSLYAAKVYMQGFQEEQAYSVGLLLHKEDAANADYGIGYMQPCSQIDSLLSTSVPEYQNRKDDGMLFFVNYHF